jgi:uncharacterized delta-60 repeat protein
VSAATDTIRTRFRAANRRHALRHAAIAAVGVATLALSAGVAAGSPAGDLDPTFEGDGKRIVSFGGADDAQQVLVQPDGKIVVAGYGGPEGDFAVARLNPDGSYDNGFDGDGRAVADFGGDDKAYAAALQPDGRIVVAGQGGSTQVGVWMAVARFDPDGSLDETFDPGGADGDGKKLFTNYEDQQEVEGVLVQPDGRIVLAGTGYGAENNDFAITRLYPKGAVDGTIFEHADFGGDDKAYGAALGPDGKLVVAGDAYGTNVEMAVARYKPDGSLDKTFGAGTGKRRFGFEDDASARAVLVQPDGKIVVAGIGGLGYDFLVARLNPDATPDPTFSTDGISTADFGGADGAYSAVLRPDGKVVAAGLTTEGGAEFAVARFLPNGALDTTFGSEGKSTVSFATADIANAVALQPDGRVVVAGQTLYNNVAVARLQADPPPAAGAGPAGGPGSAGGTARTPSTPRCAGKRATIVGTARGETLRGTPRADVIVALGGNDRVVARGGNDLVCGGRGDDRLAGGPGTDRLNGEQGKDRLSGGPGRDRLAGGAGRDRCTGGAARDRANTCETRRSL